MKPPEYQRYQYDYNYSHGRVFSLFNAKHYTETEENLPVLCDAIARHCHGKNFYTEQIHTDRFQIIFTVDGCANHTYLGKEYLLDKNSIVLPDFSNFTRYVTGSAGFYEYCFLELHGPQCKGLYQFCYENGFCLSHLTKPQSFLSIFEQIDRQIHQATPNYNLTVSILVQQILNLLFMGKDSSLETADIHLPPWYNTIMNYLHTYYNTNITMENLCELSHTSPSHFNRLFKSLTGVGPHEYIILLRMDQAKKLLRSSSDPIETIAVSLGYLSSSQFIQQFRRKEGITPLQYRKKFAKK